MARTRPAPEDTATARRILLDGLARGVQVFELLGELEPLHPRNDTFPGEVFLHLAADALDWCRASRANPLPLEGLQVRFLPELSFRGRQTRNSSTQSWPRRRCTGEPSRTCWMSSPGGRPMTFGSTPSTLRSPISAPLPARKASLYATLVGFTHQSSGDYSLVIADDQDNTMIAKIPDPELAPGSFFAQQIAATRQAFDSRFGIQAMVAPASGSARRQFIRAAEPVTLQGLGFFDYLHGQTGVAPNAFELHPVISIVFREQAPAAVNPQA